MVWWMKYQIFVPILLLQFLNLFWYYFVLRIAYRYVGNVRFVCILTDSFCELDRALTGRDDVADDRSEGDASDDEED